MARKLNGINNIKSRCMDLSLNFAVLERNGAGAAGMTG
jgi:hypothetical protein